MLEQVSVNGAKLTGRISFLSGVVKEGPRGGPIFETMKTNANAQSKFASVVLDVVEP